MGGIGSKSGKAKGQMRNEKKKLFDTNRYEKLDTNRIKNFKILKETEKAVAIDESYSLSSNLPTQNRMLWLPKSAVKIKNGVVTEAKGWLIDKNYETMSSKESDDRMYVRSFRYWKDKKELEKEKKKLQKKYSDIR